MKKHLKDIYDEAEELNISVIIETHTGGRGKKSSFTLKMQ